MKTVCNQQWITTYRSEGYILYLNSYLRNVPTKTGYEYIN